MQSLTAARSVRYDAAAFRPSSIKFSSSAPSTEAGSRATKFCRGSIVPRKADAVLSDQRADLATTLRLEHEASRQPKAEPSDALKRAVAGRPCAQEVMRGQLSARTRQEHERQRMRAEEEERRTRVAAEQLAAAAKGHKLAAARLRDQQAQRAAASAKLDDHREREAAKRGQAIAALKASTEAAHAELRSKAKDRAEKRAEASAQQEAEAAKVLQLGGNPYLAQRQKEEAQRAAREKKRQDAEHEARMSEHRSRMAATLAREKAQREKQKGEKRPAHANYEGVGGPRTLCDPSVIELGL